MAVSLLDKSLIMDVFSEKEDADLADHICVRFTEKCDDDEKIFCAEETNMYVTLKQARQIVEAFQKVIEAEEDEKDQPEK